MALYKLKSYSKINTHLSVTGKNKNCKLHKIESVFFFLNLSDEIYIKKINKKEHIVKFFGKFAKGIGNLNTVQKLLLILDKNNLLSGQKFLIKIKKNVPQQSGMGGGSMNAANILKFLIKKKIFKISNKKLLSISSLVGSDVKIGLEKCATILKSNGDMVRLRKKFQFFLTIIKPEFGCSTPNIYSNIKKFSKSKLNFKNKLSFSDFLIFHNDLEPVAFKKYPKLLKLKKTVESLDKIEFARMTGSGSTIVGYFSNKKDALNGTKILKKKFKNYWCILSKTI